MSRDLEFEVRKLARFAAEVYLIADAKVPDHLSWHVRMYDEPLHAPAKPVVELWVTRGAQGRSVTWLPELVVHNEHESRWPAMIREGVDRVLRGLAV